MWADMEASNVEASDIYVISVSALSWNPLTNDDDDSVFEKTLHILVVNNYMRFKFVMACEYEIFGKFPRTTGSVEKHSVG